MPDLVLLDLMMRGLNEFETCRRIHADEKTKKLPVIIITPLRSDTDSVDAVASGANELIAKSIEASISRNAFDRTLVLPSKINVRLTIRAHFWS